MAEVFKAIFDYFTVNGSVALVVALLVASGQGFLILFLIRQNRTLTGEVVKTAGEFAALTRAVSDQFAGLTKDISEQFVDAQKETAGTGAQLASSLGLLAERINRTGRGR